MTTKKHLFFVTSAFALSGCASMQDSIDTMAEYAGRAAGATLGAGIGYLACSNSSNVQRAACIVAGASAGWAIGDLIDQRRKALQQVSQQEGLSLVYQEIEAGNSEKAGLSTTITDQAMFPIGSFTLTSAARSKLSKVARVYQNQPQKILIIGHTDATGDSAFNQELSEKRARTVAQLFEQQGIPEDNLYFQGVGESRPTADNTTSAGRAENRRVEIVEITSEAELVAYTTREQLSLDNIRASVQTTTTPASKPGTQSASDASTRPTAASKAIVQRSSAHDNVIGTTRAPMDLGGTPIADADMDLYQTLFASSSAWKRLLPIGQAQADSSQQACYQDSYRQSGNVKRLGSGQQVEYSAEDYLPGLNRSLLVTTLEGHLIGLGPVAVTRHFEPVSSPSLYIYSQGNQQQAKYRLPVQVNIYEGEDVWLYRAFIEDQHAPVECFDLVFDKQDASKANDGRLFYAGSREMMAVNYNPARPTRQ